MTPQPHNPAGLTPEQVGVAEGWRLLDRDEIVPRESTTKIEGWDFNYFFWDRPSWSGSCPRFTYRTRLTRAELAQLP